MSSIVVTWRNIDDMRGDSIIVTASHSLQPRVKEMMRNLQTSLSIINVNQT